MEGSLFLLPYSTRDLKFKLLAITSRKEQSQVAVNDQPVQAVSDFPVAVAYASWDSLP